MCVEKECNFPCKRTGIRGIRSTENERYRSLKANRMTNVCIFSWGFSVCGVCRRNRTSLHVPSTQFIWFGSEKKRAKYLHRHEHHIEILSYWKLEADISCTKEIIHNN